MTDLIKVPCKVVDSLSFGPALSKRSTPLFFALLLLPLLAYSMPPLNDSGERLCVDDTGYLGINDTAIAADSGTHPRQDCRYGRDAAAEAGLLSKRGGGSVGFDFTKIANDGSPLPVEIPLGTDPGEWACNLDNTTGLMWEVKRDDGGLRDAQWTYYWYSSDAATNGGNVGTITGTDNCGGTLGSYVNGCNTANYVAAVNSAALCGYSDWRLPSVHELEGLIHAGAGAAPFIDQTYFPTHKSFNWSWSGTSYAPDTSRAWRVKFDNGSTFHDPKGLHHVMLVRGGPLLADGTKCDAGTKVPNMYVSTPQDDFLDNADGTVTHIPTGLMWKQCVEGMTLSAGPACTGTAAVYTTYSSALTQAKGVTFADKSDWRIPNVKELRSIVEVCGHNPAINTTLFPSDPSDLFWSSTTISDSTSANWSMDSTNGQAIGVTKTGATAYLRLVRGGGGFGSFDRIDGVSKGRINDSGVTEIQDSTVVDPSGLVSLDSGTHPRQDGRYGRDARSLTGRMVKEGGGVAGFDYTKVSNDGLDVADTTVLGNNPKNWACTRDNVTGLVWEVKTVGGLRDASYTYTWYNTDSATNGGDPGSTGSETCGETLGGLCNSESFINAVNALNNGGGLCYCASWRLPTRGELETLIYRGAASAPYIDTNFFPNQTSLDTDRSSSAISADTRANKTDEFWGIGFWDGGTGSGLKSMDYGVRLVCDMSIVPAM